MIKIVKKLLCAVLVMGSHSWAADVDSFAPLPSSSHYTYQPITQNNIWDCEILRVLSNKQPSREMRREIIEIFTTIKNKFHECVMNEFFGTEEIRAQSKEQFKAEYEQATDKENYVSMYTKELSEALSIYPDATNVSALGSISIFKNHIDRRALGNQFFGAIAYQLDSPQALLLFGRTPVVPYPDFPDIQKFMQTLCVTNELNEQNEENGQKLGLAHYSRHTEIQDIDLRAEMETWAFNRCRELTLEGNLLPQKSEKAKHTALLVRPDDVGIPAILAAGYNVYADEDGAPINLSFYKYEGKDTYAYFQPIS